MVFKEIIFKRIFIARGFISTDSRVWNSYNFFQLSGYRNKLTLINLTSSFVSLSLSFNLLASLFERGGKAWFLNVLTPPLEKNTLKTEFGLIVKEWFPGFLANYRKHAVVKLRFKKRFLKKSKHYKNIFKIVRYRSVGNLSKANRGYILNKRPKWARTKSRWRPRRRARNKGFDSRRRQIRNVIFRSKYSKRKAHKITTSNRFRFMKKTKRYYPKIKSTTLMRHIKSYSKLRRIFSYEKYNYRYRTAWFRKLRNKRKERVTNSIIKKLKRIGSLVYSLYPIRVNRLNLNLYRRDNYNSSKLTEFKHLLSSESLTKNEFIRINKKGRILSPLKSREVTRMRSYRKLFELLRYEFSRILKFKKVVTTRETWRLYKLKKPKYITVNIHDEESNLKIIPWKRGNFRRFMTYTVEQLYSKYEDYQIIFLSILRAKTSAKALRNFKKYTHLNSFMRVAWRASRSLLITRKLNYKFSMRLARMPWFFPFKITKPKKTLRSLANKMVKFNQLGWTVDALVGKIGERSFYTTYTFSPFLQVPGNPIKLPDGKFRRSFNRLVIRVLNKNRVDTLRKIMSSNQFLFNVNYPSLFNSTKKKFNNILFRQILINKFLKLKYRRKVRNYPRTYVLKKAGSQLVKRPFLSKLNYLSYIKNLNFKLSFTMLSSLFSFSNLLEFRKRKPRAKPIRLYKFNSKVTFINAKKIGRTFKKMLKRPIKLKYKLRKRMKRRREKLRSDDGLTYKLKNLGKYSPYIIPRLMKNLNSRARTFNRLRRIKPRVSPVSAIFPSMLFLARIERYTFSAVAEASTMKIPHTTLIESSMNPLSTLYTILINNNLNMTKQFSFLIDLIFKRALLFGLLRLFSNRLIDVGQKH